MRQGDQIRGTAQTDGQHEPHTLGVDIQPSKRRSGKVSRTVSTSPLMLDITVMCTSGVMAPPPGIPTRDVLPLATVVSIMDAVSTSTPLVVPPAPGIERPGMQAQDFSTGRLSKSLEFFPLFRLSSSSAAPTLPRDSAKVFRWDISRKFRERIVCSVFHRFHRESSFSLHEGAHRLRLERPCCRRRQMTVWLRIWVIRTLLRGVNSIQGQYPLGLCLDVRPSGFYCLPTGSALRISAPLLEGSLTSAPPVAPGEGGWLHTGLPSRLCRYSESGDLLCTDGNPAYGLQPHPLQSPDSTGCPESFRLQSRPAVHGWTVMAVPRGIVSPGVVV